MCDRNLTEEMGEVVSRTGPYHIAGCSFHNSDSVLISISARGVGADVPAASWSAKKYPYSFIYRPKDPRLIQSRGNYMGLYITGDNRDKGLWSRPTARELRTQLNVVND